MTKTLSFLSFCLLKKKLGAGHKMIIVPSNKVSVSSTLVLHQVHV